MRSRSAEGTARAQRLIVVSLIAVALGFLVVVQLRSQAAVARTLAAQDDTSVARLLNNLRNAGAEAIALNGQRIVSSTPVQSRGDGLLINGHPVSSPLTLLVIGDPEQLGPAADLSASSLQTRVQVEIQRQTDLAITE